MSYQKGSDMLLKADTDGAGTYVTVAAIQAKDFAIDGQQVNVTNADSASKWQELLAGAGIKSLKASGRGVFDGSSIATTVINYALNNTIRNWKVVVPVLGTFTFLAMVTQVKYAGPHDKEIQYDISLESAGAVVLA